MNQRLCDDAQSTPIVSDEMLEQYAEAYLVRKPVPDSFIAFVNHCEHIRKTREYPYEYGDHYKLNENT